MFFFFFFCNINRKDSAICDFCKTFPESIIHVFRECEYVGPIWEKLVKIIQDKHDIDFSITNFDKIVGIYGENFLTYIFCTWNVIFMFVNFKIRLRLLAWKSLLTGIETLYTLLLKRVNLSAHFKKWRFDF